MRQGDQLAAWLRDRCGNITGSNMSRVLDFTAKGEPGAKRKNYIKDVAAERITGQATDNYVSPSMLFGLEMEDEGKGVWQARTGVILTECDYIAHPVIRGFGATPDGLIDDDGCLELKAPDSSTFVEWAIAGVVPEQHKPQMIAECACAGRSWCEFVAFDPRVKDEAHQLFIVRFTPTPEQIAAVEAAATKAVAEVEAMVAAFNASFRREAA